MDTPDLYILWIQSFHFVAVLFVILSTQSDGHHYFSKETILTLLSKRTILRSDRKTKQNFLLPASSEENTSWLELLHFYTPSQQLRSSTDTRVFRIPSFRTESSSQRSFSYQAPVIWNKLPVSVRHSASVSSFKSSLKIFLFLKTFSSVSLP